jgi:hypothetical protein
MLTATASTTYSKARSVNQQNMTRTGFIHEQQNTHTDEATSQNKREQCQTFNRRVNHEIIGSKYQ